jgi:3-isopropylmalate/(R)-2-methylmalate dehydratase small subunit
MEPFTTLTSRVLALPAENVDTDQIIPARYLKTTSRAGLGENLFANWRYDAAGQPKPDFLLNQPEARGANILLAGDNFGCGSSREHAPWALLDYGFRAIISTSFADIFRNNALKNGLLPVVVDEATHRQLISLAEEDPGFAVSIDLATQTVRLPDGVEAHFPIDEFSKNCLLDGVDELGFLLARAPQVDAYEAEHAARINSLAAQPSGS